MQVIVTKSGDVIEEISPYNLKMILDAFRNKTLIDFSYEYLEPKEDGRVWRNSLAQPIAFVLGVESTQLLTYDIGRQGFRRFALRNIYNLQPTEMSWLVTIAPKETDTNTPSRNRL